MASVLVIEDDQRIRETIARALADNGHAVRTEGRGTDALGVVVDWRPDVVVLDLGLPDLDGARRAPDGAGRVDRSRDRRHGPRRRRRDRAAARRRRRRLRDQALLRRAARRPHPGRAAARRRRRRRAPTASWSASSRSTPTAARRPSTASRSSSPASSSTCSPTSPAAARRSVTRRELLAEVWRQPYGGADKTIDVHLSWLRRKLGETAGRAPLPPHRPRRGREARAPDA